MFEKLFQQTRYEKWWDSLSPNTKIWLSKQPIWHDKDVAVFISISFALGVLIGTVITYR